MQNRLGDQLVGLASLLMVLSGIFLRATAKVAIAMSVLWFIGLLYPYVAQAIGIPQTTLYRFLVETFSGLFALIGHF